MEKIFLPPDPPTPYKSKYTGDEVEDRLDAMTVIGRDIEHIIDDIATLNDRVDGKENKVPGKGLSTNDFTNELKRKLDSMNIKVGTTSYWNSMIGFVPKDGEIIIYSDHSTIERYGEMVNVPGFKVGTGRAYVQDLAFADEALSQILASHVTDSYMHVRSIDRIKWDNKVSIDDDSEVVEKTLILQRD